MLPIQWKQHKTLGKALPEHPRKHAVVCIFNYSSMKAKSNKAFTNALWYERWPWAPPGHLVAPAPQCHNTDRLRVVFHLAFPLHTAGGVWWLLLLPLLASLKVREHSNCTGYIYYIEILSTESPAPKSSLKMVVLTDLYWSLSKHYADCCFLIPQPSTIPFLQIFNQFLLLLL